MELPKDIFGMRVSVGGELPLGGYPLLYRTAYEVREASIGRCACIALSPRGSVKPAQIQKVAAAISGGEGMPCLAVVPSASAYQRRSLSERGVSWISSDDTFHIPFLAASSAPVGWSPKARAAFSPRAQQVAAHLVDGSWEGYTTSQVAAELGVSLSSAVNYLKEIASRVPEAVATRGRERYLTRAGRAAAELYQILAPSMGSPVASRVYLKPAAGEGLPALFGTLPASGVTALAMQTALADDPWETRAAWAKDPRAEALRACCVEVVREDEPDVLLELWRYDPGDGAAVGGVPLLLDLEDIAEGEGDERLDSAVLELKERVLR